MQHFACANNRLKKINWQELMKNLRVVKIQEEVNLKKNRKNKI